MKYKPSEKDMTSKKYAGNRNKSPDDCKKSSYGIEDLITNAEKSKPL